MIALPPGARIWLAAGVTDMRKGFGGLAALVQETLAENAFSGQMFVFRGRRGDLVKLLWWSGDGMNLYAKRLGRGRFVWPQARSESLNTSSQGGTTCRDLRRRALYLGSMIRGCLE